MKEDTKEVFDKQLSVLHNIIVDEKRFFNTKRERDAYMDGLNAYKESTRVPRNSPKKYRFTSKHIKCKELLIKKAERHDNTITYNQIKYILSPQVPTGFSEIDFIKNQVRTMMRYNILDRVKRGYYKLNTIS